MDYFDTVIMTTIMMTRTWAMIMMMTMLMTRDDEDGDDDDNVFTFTQPCENNGPSYIYLA